MEEAEDSVSWGDAWSCGQRSLGRLQEEPLPGWTAHPARVPGSRAAHLLQRSSRDALLPLWETNQPRGAGRDDPERGCHVFLRPTPFRGGRLLPQAFHARAWPWHHPDP